MEYGLRYLGDGQVKLQVYTNLDWAGSATDRKSTLGCCFSLGSVMISWSNRKQDFVSLISVEREYMVANTTSCEALWIHKLLAELFDLEFNPIVIYCDN